MQLTRLVLLCSLFALTACVARAADPYSRFAEQAERETAGELQLHIIQTYGRLSNFIHKVRAAERVPGWQQIRVRGDAAFAAWDSLRKDFVWHGGKFEVLFDIVDAKELKLNSVTFDGTTTKADS